MNTTAAVTIASKVPGGKMDKATLEALKGSIAHWEGIKSGTEADKAGSCALCNLFAVGRDGDSMCHGCPVMARTGKKSCSGTPYYAFAGTYSKAAGGETAVNAKQRAAAQAEINFLRSLLPEDAA